MTLISRLTNTPLRGVLWLALLSQLGLGGALVYGDVQLWMTGAIGPEVRPTITDPAGPGDQRRRYSPGTVPSREGREGGPINLPPEMEEMTFRFQQTEEYGRVLLLSGKITVGTSDRYERALDGVEPPDTIALHSPGGVVQEALRIGELVRKSEFDTLMTADAACNSACPLILFAGTERIISRQSWVGMHQASFGTGSFITGADATRQVQIIQGRILEHITEMGVDARVQTHALATPPEEVYYLLEDQLTDYNVATQLID